LVDLRPQAPHREYMSRRGRPRALLGRALPYAARPEGALGARSRSPPAGDPRPPPHPVLTHRPIRLVKTGVKRRLHTSTWQGIAITSFGYPKTLKLDCILGVAPLVLLPLMAPPRRAPAT